MTKSPRLSNDELDLLTYQRMKDKYKLNGTDLGHIFKSDLTACRSLEDNLHHVGTG